MISFDVKLIFTIVPLDRIVDIILRRTFDNQEIQTTLWKKELKELLILCTKNIYFNFGGKTFLSVAKGSPLGLVLADILMVYLENVLVPTLTEYMKFWKRYVDGTICFVKFWYAMYIALIVNSFNANIQLSYKKEKNVFYHSKMFWLQEMEIISSLLFIIKQHQMIIINTGICLHQLVGKGEP